MSRNIGHVCAYKFFFAMRSKNFEANLFSGTKIRAASENRTWVLGRGGRQHRQNCAKNGLWAGVRAGSGRGRRRGAPGPKNGRFSGPGGGRFWGPKRGQKWPSGGQKSGDPSTPSKTVVIDQNREVGFGPLHENRRIIHFLKRGRPPGRARAGPGEG